MYARSLIIQSEALVSTLDLAQRYADEAKSALRVFEISDWRISLEALADFAVSRAA
jgi:octaprenyl-diphosphate synthase